MARSLGALLALVVSVAAVARADSRRTTVAVSASVVRSVRVTARQGPQGAEIAVRTPDGVTWSSRAADVGAMAGGPPPASGASSSAADGYVVVTILADAPIRN